MGEESPSFQPQTARRFRFAQPALRLRLPLPPQRAHQSKPRPQRPPSKQKKIPDVLPPEISEIQEKLIT